MRKSLIAQSVAAVIAGLVVSTGASAAVVGPTAAAAVLQPAVATVADAAASLVAAQELVVNTDGIGHINLIPYYTVQGGYDTYVNIVNTDTRNGKAVKVRFRGASNSDDVFDFTLLLSPGDKFGFAVTRDATSGLPKIALAGDTSCTLGDGVNNINGKSFITSRLNPRLTGDALAAEAREGYVEILNMADIPPNAGTSSLFQTVKHKSVGGTWKATCDLTILANTLGSNPTTYADAQSRGLEVPSTGLVTNWTLINVAKAAAYTGAATAVEARTTAGIPGYGNIVLFAQNATALPFQFDAGSPAAGGVSFYTADPLLRSWTAGGATAATTPGNYDLPDLSTPYLNAALTAGVLTTAAAPAAGADIPLSYAAELTRSLAVSSVANEFNTFDGLAASTDWIFSLPTRRYNIAVSYGATAALMGIVASDYTDGATLFPVGAPVAPVNYFVENTATGAAAPNGNVIFNPDDTTKAYQLCVTGIAFASPWTGGTSSLTADPRRSGATLDFDERNLTVDDPSNPFVISPSQPGVVPTLAFCGEVAVFKFGRAAADASVLGATVAVKGLQDIEFDNGWTRLATPGWANAGLPIIGSAVTELNNSGVGAVGAGYGQTFPHRMTRPGL